MVYIDGMEGRMKKKVERNEEERNEENEEYLF